MIAVLTTDELENCGSLGRRADLWPRSTARRSRLESETFNLQQTVQKEIKGILAFIGAIWVVFLLENITPFNLTAFGVTPRTMMGLIGIPAMPFLHGNLQHIVSNTVPLCVLLMLLVASMSPA